MNAALALTAFFAFGGLLAYTLIERRHRNRWVRFEQRPDPKAPRAPFRREAGPGPTRAVMVQRRAPATIRRTALWSIYMGQMAVPGGLLGLFGLLAAGIGLVSIPGLILAIRISRLGLTMLRRDPGAELEARKLQRFAVILNLVAVVVAFVLPLLDPQLAPVSLVLLVYGAVSFAHAWAMGRCADVLAEDRRLRARDEAPTDAPTAAAPHLRVAA